MTVQALRIATRGSELALWQANHVAELLRDTVSGLVVELVHVTTTGDQDRLLPLRQLGGVGVFTREVQQAVLDGRADVAVHSLKDLPTEPAEGLVLAAVPGRASMFDALVLPAGAASVASLSDLPAGTRIGTSSLRRQAQVSHLRPDLEPVEIRGNVPTRIQKLDRGEYDAIILAEAGLARLGLADRISLPLRPPVMFPAAGQGALGLECRADDHRTRARLAEINDPAVNAAVRAERALLAELRAGCHAPVGVETRLEADTLHLHAVVLGADGSERLASQAGGPLDAPEALGRAVAAALRTQGADRLIAPTTD